MVAEAKSWDEVQHEAPVFQTEAAVAVERAVVHNAAVMMGPAGERGAAVQSGEESKVCPHPFGCLWDLKMLHDG